MIRCCCGDAHGAELVRSGEAGTPDTVVVRCGHHFSVGGLAVDAADPAFGEDLLADVARRADGVGRGRRQLLSVRQACTYRRAVEGVAVSDLWTSPSAEEETASRRRALWGLVVLVALGVIVGLMMVVVGRSRSGRSGEGLVGVAPTTLASPPALGTVASQARPPTTSSNSTGSASMTGHPTLTSTAGRCPSTAPCVVAGDGGAVAALNAFRTSHGRAVVPGAATGPAQQCALSQGNGPSCAPHFAWQPVPTRDGTKVISMIASRNDGVAWLLDPDMTAFRVGWAYVPGADGSGQYWCAILKVG